MSNTVPLSIDLNADLGEGSPMDAELMTVVTSCNIACGGHAGDAASMRLALQQARAHGVSAGAHPSFPDRENFGRSNMDLSGPELVRTLTEQIQSLRALSDKEGLVLGHLKPHGALYNMAAKDAELASNILEALQIALPEAHLVGPPASELQRAADANGVLFVAEGFADRAYESDGQLRPRSEPGAVIHEPKQQSRQALEIATQQQVTTYQGEIYPLPAQTICVHGDTPAAFEAAKAIKAAFESQGLTICAPR
ncbi:MAG: 5-oxoprolinase subunit PxpA [Pseudomonadota bacterium]